VLLSAQSQAPGSQAALAELCRIYWSPIYVFVRRRGHDADEAQDLTQGFFLHLLDHIGLWQDQTSATRKQFPRNSETRRFECLFNSMKTAKQEKGSAERGNPTLLTVL
jgi:hypothetical protein